MGHLRNISTKLFENRSDAFGGEDFLSFHYSHIRQNSHAPLAAMFFDQSTWLEESDRGSSKEHFYKTRMTRAPGARVSPATSLGEEEF